MNTSGYIRGYQAKNMKSEDFLKVVVWALNKEFAEIKEEIKLESINDGFIISLKEYKVTMRKDILEKLKSPYGIDKHLLEKFERQGFKFDRERSQYIQYCFGNYIGARVISK